MQRVCPCRENDAFCAGVNNFQIRKMSNEGLNLSSEIPMCFNALNVVENRCT